MSNNICMEDYLKAIEENDGSYLYKDDIYLRSKTYDWEVLVGVYFQPDPEKLHFGQWILEMEYISKDFQIKASNSFLNPDDAVSGDYHLKLFDYLKEKVFDYHQGDK